MGENIIGIGTDIENIARFSSLQKIKSQLFFKKIFSKKELNYCFSKKNPAQHLAARFAAKEAVTKALEKFNIKSPDYNWIEIINNQNGAPTATIHNPDFNNLQIHISLSHCKDKALAFAIVAERRVR